MITYSLSFLIYTVTFCFRYWTDPSSEDRRFKADEGKITPSFCQHSCVLPVGETYLFLFLTNCSHCGSTTQTYLGSCLSFPPRPGLLEAFKETTEGAQFFKEETCKGTVFCVGKQYVCVVLFACLCVFSFHLSDETSQPKTLLRNWYQPTGQKDLHFNCLEMKFKNRIRLGLVVTDLWSVFLTFISKA